MTYRIYGALVAPLSVAALVLAANESYGRSGAAPVARPAWTHPAGHPSVARSLRHRWRNNVGAFWPGVGDAFYGPESAAPDTLAAPPASGDVHHTYTYTYDMPWDAVHRFPPAVAPSTRPYVSECTAQTVTVPQRAGAEQTADINIVRCY